MRQRYEILAKTCCYAGFFTVNRYRLRHERFAGGWSRPMERELLERGHAVGVIAYDPGLDQVVMVEQFRIGGLEAPGGPWMLEFIAGIVEPGERGEVVAVRETMEEAGIAVRDLTLVSDFVLSPGGSSERLALYCGRVDAATAGGIHGVEEEGEDIRVRVLDRRAALALLDSTENLLSATTVVGLQWLALHHAELRARWRTADPPVQA